MRELCLLSARELVRLIQTRQISAREVMAAHLDRINRLNPAINAVVAKLPDEMCLGLAERADARLRAGAGDGRLFGLPVAFKDTDPATGFPCTQGSAIFRDARPAAD